jgi:hypothetical protein
MFLDEHDDWIDGFASWEEVWPLLMDDWMVLRDDRQRLEVRHGDGLLVYESPERRLRARQRRGLHRLGFRPGQLGRLTEWVWDLEAILASTDLAAFATPMERMFDDWPPDARPAKVAQLRRRFGRQELLREQVQRVVHDVFRSDPTDVAIAIYREPDPWADEDEESWSMSTR